MKTNITNTINKNENNKKDNITNSAYQSSFLPLIEKAEIEIKKIVLNGALNLKSKYEIRQKIKLLIYTLSKKLPKKLKDRDKYLEGLYFFSERQIRDTYDDLLIGSSILLALLFSRGLSKKRNLTPIQALEEIHKGNIKEEDLRLVKSDFVKYHAKGTPYVKDYEKLVKEKVHQLANENVLIGGGDKQAISIWQKAELDIRHEEQMNNLHKMQDSGVVYARLSSHPDCSKRCEKWQGKLVDIQAQTSELSGFRMRTKINGEQVYCLNDIISQVDNYGYTNNILVGFNCRHHLIMLGKEEPNVYSEKDIQEQRKINATLRAMERKIRYLKQKAILFNEVGDKKSATIYLAKARQLTEKYKDYANKNGYAWHDYRIKV